MPLNRIDMTRVVKEGEKGQRIWFGLAQLSREESHPGHEKKA